MASFEIKILKGYNNFVMKLYSKSGQGEDRNFLVSPMSMFISFSMLCGGAKNASESDLKHLINCADMPIDDLHKEALLLLEYLEKISTNVLYKVINKVFLNETILVNDEFNELIKNIYKNDVKLINLNKPKDVASQLNQWLDEQAKGKFYKQINDTVLMNDMKMLLLNAVYFKGNWLQKFDKWLTFKEKFFLMNDAGTVSVQMMTLHNRKFKYQSTAAELDAAICELPYFGDYLSMTIILPHKHTDLVTIECQLTRKDMLREILEPYDLMSKVNIHIPKFRIENNLELSEVMKSMGGSHVFNGARSDFSRITNESSGIYLSKCLHKTVVEIDEEGVASLPVSNQTEFSWSPVSSFSSPIDEFKCNRPFLFIIHDTNYRIPLLIGKYTRPE